MNIFISHSAKDQHLAARIAYELEREGLRSWTYDEIEPGENWANRVAQALETSDLMLVLLTPHAIESQWLRHDIEFALSTERYKNRLFSAMVGDVSQGDFPWILQSLPHVTVQDAESGITEIARQVNSLVRSSCHAE